MFRDKFYSAANGITIIMHIFSVQLKMAPSVHLSSRWRFKKLNTVQFKMLPSIQISSRWHHQFSLKWTCSGKSWEKKLTYLFFSHLKIWVTGFLVAHQQYIDKSTLSLHPREIVQVVTHKNTSVTLRRDTKYAWSPWRNSTQATDSHKHRRKMRYKKRLFVLRSCKALNIYVHALYMDGMLSPSQTCSDFITDFPFFLSFWIHFLTTVERPKRTASTEHSPQRQHPPPPPDSQGHPSLMTCAGNDLCPWGLESTPFIGLIPWLS